MTVVEAVTVERLCTSTTRFGAAEDGSVVTVTFPTADAGRVEAIWPPLGLARHQVHDGPAASTIQLLSGADAPTVVVDGAERPGGWFAFESQLALFAAERLVGRVAVHAGLVVWHGRGLLLPGSSFAGKSTLCLALSDLGAQVLTDEYALVDPISGRCQGWPRPVRRRRVDGGVDQVDLVRRHPGAVLPEVDVSLIASLEYQPGRPPAWADIDGMGRIRAVLANTVSAAHDPNGALDAALAVTRRATGLVGTRADAHDAARQLLDCVEQMERTDCAGGQP